jgi:hypothetical protein
MDIALRERDGDASFTQGFVHHETQVAGHTFTPGFAGIDPIKYLENQRTVAKVLKTDLGFRTIKYLPVFKSGRKQGPGDFTRRGTAGDADFYRSAYCSFPECPVIDPVIQQGAGLSMVF